MRIAAGRFGAEQPPWVNKRKQTERKVDRTDDCCTESRPDLV
jgi:hypothetical protein